VTIVWLAAVPGVQFQIEARGRQMTANGSKPDTIVLIHGFWVTPRSREHWIALYEARGYRVLAPPYPGV
jgi:pimeloyl-ACP methyl ester carboxylesterase